MKAVKILAIGCAAIGILVVAGMVVLVIFVGRKVEDHDVAKLVATECMLPAIGPEDCFATVQSYVLWDWNPKPGDVIYFGDEADDRAIRRVLGSPGDRVRRSNDRLFLNGELVSELSPVAFEGGISHPNLVEHNPRTAEAEFVVGEREVLVTGDQSASQVFSCGWQLVPFERIVGKVVLLARSCEGQVRDGPPIVISNALTISEGLRGAARNFYLGYRGFVVDDLTATALPPETK